MCIRDSFDGVHFTEGAIAGGDCQYEADSGFLKQQAASSSNVGGEKLCVLNGGLNYQIEHHLFPRIAHSHYPRISEKVRPFVTSKGGQYIHFDTVWDNLSSVHKYLKRFSDPLFNPVVKGPARPSPELTDSPLRRRRSRMLGLMTTTPSSAADSLCPIPGL